LPNPKQAKAYANSEIISYCNFQDIGSKRIFQKHISYYNRLHRTFSIYLFAIVRQNCLKFDFILKIGQKNGQDTINSQTKQKKPSQ